MHRPIQSLLAGLLLSGMVSGAGADIPLDSLHGPICGMIDPVTKMQAAISPSFTRVNVVITDAVAQAVVTQRFVNPFNAKTEVVYLFPLPDQGAVHGMKYEYHDSLYIAKILERQQAQAIYDSIKNNGGQAALLLQDRPNIFQQRIASMGPGETAFVEIRLSMPLKYADGELELAFPTRIGPRYQAAGGKRAAGDSPWNPPENRSGSEFEFNVLIQSGLELGSIHSPTHPIEVAGLPDMRQALEQRRLVEPNDKPSLAFARCAMLKTAPTYPNRDFVLRVARAKSAQDFSLAVATDARGQGYFMLNLYPDPALFSGKRADMELVMLLDISGSQAGWPLEREKEIALNILSRLAPTDDIDILSFSDNVSYAFGNNLPVPASVANLAKGETFIRGLSTQGGTQLLAAVNAALAVPAKSGKQRYFVFLTDGFITNETAILEAIRTHPSRPVIFTFGAGNNLNRFFLEECAKVGNGFATPMVQGDAVGPLVETAWGRIESPQLQDISVDFGGLAVSEVLSPVSNRLYHGLPYRVTGKFEGEGTHAVSVKAFKAGTEVRFSRGIDFSLGGGLGWAVPKLWAREKIGQLMLAQGTGQANKGAIIEVSLEHQVLSAYTAFLASQPQATTPGNNISANLPTLIGERARLEGLYELAVRGGMLFLDWTSAVKVEAIRIYDLQGRLVFQFRPGARAGALARWAWDGRDGNGRMLGAGRYMISVQTRRGTSNRLFVWNPR